MHADTWVVLLGAVLSPLVSVWLFNAVNKKQKTTDGETKATALALLQQAFSEFKIQFDKETGGNSGGLREAVNGLKDGQTRLEGLIQDHNKFHLEQGAQHG